MTRTAIPFVADDVSALARALKRELDGSAAAPGHVQLLNMLTRAAGYRNFQHFRAQQGASGRLEAQPAPVVAEPVDMVRVERAARHFDAAGHLARWPSKQGLQVLCVWVVWARIAAGRDFTEREISDLITAEHTFGDYALIRRWMIDLGLMGRTLDGRRYWRIEQRPPAEAVALIRHVGRSTVPG